MPRFHNALPRRALPQADVAYCVVGKRFKAPDGDGGTTTSSSLPWVDAARFELATSCMRGRRSPGLSYAPIRTPGCLARANVRDAEPGGGFMRPHEDASPESSYPCYTPPPTATTP